ncbi:glycoside hydrolase family 15 protein [Halostella salina]|uniref:glycoside hydrolase family 15 protein n=1 Tax=Halostella salina TaxID=1547897 RepID=UPI000EF7D186|nr:glycoside hydrolase family 15 protein [Halostella salina]
MQLRVAIEAFKRDRGGRFPEELRTTGAFAGDGDRLVHVDPDGGLRDYGYPLSGLYGIRRSRFGVESDGAVRWFDDMEPIRQRYVGETALVETVLDAGDYAVHQYDLTLDERHLTRVELRGDVPDEPTLVAVATFAPDGVDARVGTLFHEDAVETFHRTESDFLGASTAFDAGGDVQAGFAGLLDDDPAPFPTDSDAGPYETGNLTPNVVLRAPMERGDRTAAATLCSLLSDRDEVDRGEAIDRVTDALDAHDDRDALLASARDAVAVRVPDDQPFGSVVADDVRTLDLLAAENGAHIAGPDFDPFYANSGGYGYTWFRDDAEVTRYVAAAGDDLDLPVGDLAKSAAFYCETQREDGTWPHRVWPSDASLAPGWANARLEDGDDVDYQADQTASVVTFLAEYLREVGEDERVAEALGDALDGLNDSLAEDGLPVRCQNAWENMDGRFTHTAATFLQAYASLALAPVDGAVRERARKRARKVYEGLDRLWVPDRGVYALREDRGELDDRLDSGTFALVEAHRAYDEAVGVDDERVDRLASHVETTVDGLWHDPDGSSVRGLRRFEGDDWRTADQDGEKIWSVSTGWGAVALAHLADLTGDDGYLDRAAELLEPLLPGGPLTTETDLLAEQVFDDGTLDCATPLGWSHALRLRAVAMLDARDALPRPSDRVPTGPTDDRVWTTGETYGFGTAADHGSDDPSEVWFACSEGAMTEVRYPRVDLMNLRTVDFLVVDADGGYAARTFDERRTDGWADTLRRETEPAADGSLAFRQTVTEPGDGRGHAWTLTAEYATDPANDAVLVDVEFAAEDGNEYDVYAVADAHLGNRAGGDAGRRVDAAGDAGYALALSADGGAVLRHDDGGVDVDVAAALAAGGRFDWVTVEPAGSDALRTLCSGTDRPAERERLDDEHVVAVGRIAAGVGERTETLALGFGSADDDALRTARAALDRGYDGVREEYDATWRAYLDGLSLPDSVAGNEGLADQYRTALMTLKAVESKRYPGAGVASPCVPWGESVSADVDRGRGYNFVWSRDLYQAFTAFDAVDDVASAREATEYVYEHQQRDDGFVPQNTYVDGRTRWGGEQLDNVAFPAVMAHRLAGRGVSFDELAYGYDDVARSADYVVRNGPDSEQERWEEERGYSPSTIAAEIASLACAADLAADAGERGDALVYLAVADEWAASVEEMTAAADPTGDRDPPYYVRVSRDGDPDAADPLELANDGPTLDERDCLDAGFLELVRLGIKSADDETVRNSVVAVDDAIRVETPHGPGFYRYVGDSYGELLTGPEGADWDITDAGKGRLWPIFTGERGEYELRREGGDDPADLLSAMAGFGNTGRMIPEQVWDAEFPTEFGWSFGEGTGSATPLSWSMAGFVRLAHGVDAGEPVETPTVVRERYAEGDRGAGPSLTVTVRNAAEPAGNRADGGTVTVAGETDGVVVACKTRRETVAERVDGGEFEFEVPADGHVTVAAATHDDPFAGGTSVRRFEP